MGDVHFINNGANNFNINHSQPSLFHKGLTLSGSGAFNFSALTFVGNGNGIFTDNRVLRPNLNVLNLAKTDGATLTLGTPLIIANTVNFNGGDLITSNTASLIFIDNASHTNASNLSKVLGPVKKMGNDAFTFPVGKTGKYIPLSISAPAQITDEFSAQVIDANASTMGFDTASRASGLAVINGGDFFDLSRTAGSSNVSVQLGYNFGMGAISDQSVLRVAHWNGTLWEDLGNATTTGNLEVGTVISAGLVNNFSPFAVAATNAMLAPLPVLLQHFGAVLKNDKVLIDWKVSNEANLSHYQVERSADGERFETLSIVNAQNKTEYGAIDAKPITGKNFYRLRMVDHDGQTAFSPMAMILNDGAASWTISPNPAKRSLQVHNAGNYSSYSIYDLQGRKVLAGHLGNAVINVEQLPAATYILQLENGQKATQLQFVKQ